MKLRTTTLALVGLASGLLFCVSLNAEPPAAKGDAPATAPDQRIPVAEARERARLMHKIYANTLEALHRHYFRGDRAVLPARALEDVFADVDEQAKIKTRWIAVNTQAMSVHHEPKTDFEKQAAAALAGGKTEFDRVEDGYYRRAGVIPLSGSCLACHTRFFSTPPKTPRFAGLVISIPVDGK
ncbi:MAG: DUF3365 domain-containing protein [Gemmataceae bacterium]